MLVYGDYHSLHMNVLTKLFMHAPEDKVEIRLWLNVVCPETLAWLAVHRRPKLTIYISDQNVPKYQLMRTLFHDAKRPINTEWITWFDDDAVIVKPDWLGKTHSFIESKRHDNVCFFGQERRKGHQPGIQSFVKASKWYKGRRFQTIKGEKGSRYHGPGIVFVQGSYWWLRTAAMRKLNWPDPRLSHNGGDTLLSEAVWQQEFSQHNFFYGVIPNNAARRGLSENPAGFKYNKRAKTDGKTPTMVGKMDEYFKILSAHSIAYEESAPDLIMISSPAKVPQLTRSQRELKFRRG